MTELENHSLDIKPPIRQAAFSSLDALLLAEARNDHSEQRKGELKGRFAPSPTGRMHAGNIYAALMAWLIAKSQGGRIVLRIEDLDSQRSKPQFVDQLQRDFELLGLFWDEGPYFQQDRENYYNEALQYLSERDLVYPCFCARADLHAASAPHKGEKPIYAGTCRNLTHNEQKTLSQKRSPALRLKVDSSIIKLEDAIQGCYSQQLNSDCGDFIIKRSDGCFAYQLAVVLDDAACNIGSVVRGVDLLSSTPQQIYLQNLLGLPHPQYAHIPLLVAPDGRRLSKRHKDASLETLLGTYKTPQAILGHIAWLVGLIKYDEAVTPQDLLSSFKLERWTDSLKNRSQISWC